MLQMAIIMVNPIRRANELDRIMSIHELHPEDVKAALRKKFGTVREFERAKKLPINGVADVLRGRTSERVTSAVESVLIEAQDTGSRSPAKPKNLVNKKKAAA
jgi:lambda repressor-like predicted transcriptional regulator